MPMRKCDYYIREKRVRACIAHSGGRATSSVRHQNPLDRAYRTRGVVLLCQRYQIDKPGFPVVISTHLQLYGVSLPCLPSTEPEGSTVYIYF